LGRNHRGAERREEKKRKVVREKGGNHEGHGEHEGAERNVAQPSRLWDGGGKEKGKLKKWGGGKKDES